MKRATLYAFIQACLLPDTDYVTEVGLVSYPKNIGNAENSILIFDALIDRYLLYPHQPIQIPLRQLIKLTEGGEEEIIQTLVALALIKFSSNHEEYPLLKIQQMETDDKGEIVLTFELNNWLAYHLTTLSEVSPSVLSPMSMSNKRLELKI